MRLETVPPSQGDRQLYWLLPQRIQLRRRATLRRNRPPRQQARPGAAGRSSLAAITLAAQLACPEEILGETQSWCITEKENGSGASSTVGHRSVALENRPCHRCGTGLDSSYQADVGHKPLTLTKNALSNQSSIETAQGGTLLDDEAGPLEKGPSVRWGAFRPRRLPEVNYDIMGSHQESDARIGAGDPLRRGNAMREAAPCGSIQPS